MDKLLQFLRVYKTQLCWALTGFALLIAMLIAKEAVIAVLGAAAYLVHGSRARDEQERQRELDLRARRAAEAHQASLKAMEQRERTHRVAVSEAVSAANKAVDAEIDADFPDAKFK